MARRSIYSRRQAQAPGTYETPLADFLDALPQYVTQYQQNKLQLQKQELANKRYDDSVKRQQERDNRADYDRILSRLGKYDYANMKKVADQYGYEDDSMSFSSMIDNQSNTLSGLRDKINQVQNLGTEASYFDYDKITKDISPQDIEMLSERDKFGYDTLVNSKKRFDTQRRTGMRSMSQSDKTKYENFNKLYLQSENALVKAYADLGVDIRGRDFEDSAGLLKTLSESGINPTDEVRSLTRDVNRFSGEIKKLDAAYKITEPVNELPGEEVPPSITQDGVTSPLAPSYSFDNYYNSEELLANTAPDSPSSALSMEEQAEAMYTLASATEDSDEYKKAQEKLGNMDSLNILESKPLPGLGGLIERLSVAGQERAETGEGMRGIRPESPISDLPPVENPNDPEYVDRVLSQFDKKLSQLKTLTLRPEQYRGSGASNKVNQINANLKAKDNLVAQIKELYSRMPKTKKFESQLKSIKSILQDNPTGLEAFLDSKARGGRGEFKFKKGKVSEEDKVLLAELNNILNFESEQEQQEPNSAVENLIRAIAPIRADAPSGVRVPQN